MRILSFDVESANGNPKTASLCSFGYCISDENFNIIEQRDILVNPVGNRFFLTNYKGTKGIKLAYSVNEFRNSPTFDSVYSEIENIFKSADIVIGFSIINDLNYLNSACTINILNCYNFSFLDVQDIYYWFTKDKNKIGLDKIAEKYTLDYTEHRSDEDARVTLLILKKICEELNTNLNGIIDKYKIVLGRNDKNGYMLSYSLAQMLGENGLSRPSKIKRFLFNSALKGQRKKSGILSGKRFCFAKNLVYDDVDYSRKLVRTIYDKGGVYCVNSKECNVYVTNKSEISPDNFDQKVMVIDEQKLLEMISPLISINFDDENRIRRYFIQHRVKE